MKYVSLLQLQNDGSQKAMAICTLENNTVSCIGDNKLIASLTQNGINDYSDNSQRKLFPQDGEKFLSQLKYNFKSGYLNATDIMEK